MHDRHQAVAEDHPTGGSNGLHGPRRYRTSHLRQERLFGLYFGFGFEGVDGQREPAELMRRTVDYLLAD
jgi:hypothetical protein